MAPRSAHLIGKRLRTIIMIVVMAAVLVPAAPRSAHAVFIIDDAIFAAIGAIKLVVDLLEELSAKVQSTIAPISENVNKRFEHNNKHRIELEKQKAADKASKEKYKAKLDRPYRIPPGRSMCRAVTTAARLSFTSFSTATSAAQAAQMQMEQRLGPSSRRGGDDTGATAAIDAVEQFDTALCPYSNDPDVIAQCPPPKPGVPAPGSLPLADVMASTLTGGLAFDSAAHEAAASALCANITANTRPDVLRGNAIYGNVDSVSSFNKSLSEEAMLGAASQVCLESWSRRRAGAGSNGLPGYAPVSAGRILTDADCTPPSDQSTASSTPASSGPSNSSAGVNGPSGGASRASSTASSTPTNPYVWAYCRLQKVGWKPVAGNLAANYTWSATNPSIAMQRLYNSAAMPSELQLREAVLVQPQQDEFIEGTAGRPENQIRNLMIAKSITLRQQFYQYQNLEKQVLLQAITLSRKTRALSGNL